MFNNMKVFVLMAGLTALFVSWPERSAVSRGCSSRSSLPRRLDFSAYDYSGAPALRAFQARIVSRDEAPELYDIVDQLGQKADLPMPKVAVAPHQQPMPSHPAAMRDMRVPASLKDHAGRRPQRAGGRARAQIGHIKNADILLQTMTTTLAGAVGMIRASAWSARLGVTDAAAHRSAHGAPRAVCRDADPVRDQSPAPVRRRPAGAELTGPALDLASGSRNSTQRREAFQCSLRPRTRRWRRWIPCRPTDAACSDCSDASAHGGAVSGSKPWRATWGRAAGLPRARREGAPSTETFWTWPRLDPGRRCCIAGFAE